MNRKIARLGAVTAAVAGLGTAAIVPLAGSASAATTSASAATTSYVLKAELPFTGYGPSQDLQDCENLAQPLQKLFPNDVVICHLYYTPSNPLSGNDDLWTAWFYEFVPS